MHLRLAGEVAGHDDLHLARNRLLVDRYLLIGAFLCGAGEGRVILKHALKNAMIPIITVIGLSVAMLVAGAVVTETVFGLPGVGNLVVSAVLRRDYPVIQGALLVVAAIYVLINFIVDMLYILVDPRVRL